MHSAFIARQPIFDRKLDVVAYELLFRGRGYAGDGLSDNPGRATATVVSGSERVHEIARCSPIARLSRSTISRGVPEGATIAKKPSMTTPGTVSCNEGSSGNPGKRLPEVTARRRTLPA